MKIKKIITLALAVTMAFSVSACSGGGNKPDNNGGNNVKKEYIVPTYDDEKDLTIGVWQGSFVYLKENHVADLKDAGVNTFVGCHDVDKSVLDLFSTNGISVIAEYKYYGKNTIYTNHPSVIGYSVDEPAKSQFDTVATNYAQFKQSDPDKLFYVNLFPSYGGTGALGGTYDKYVGDFVEKVKPPVLSFDHYPIQKDSDTPDVNTVRETFFYDYDVNSHYAKQAGVPLWTCIETAAHQSYPDMTVEELRWQMSVAMAYGAQGFMHYVYSSHESGYNPMVTMDGTKTELFEKVKTVDLEILEWDDIYLSFDWQGVVPVAAENGTGNVMFDLLQYAMSLDEVDGVTDVTSSADVLMGAFEDKDGNKGFMLTNATNPSLKTDATVKVTFSDEYKGVMIVEDGETNIVDLTNGAATIELNAGEGKFIIPLKVK